MRDILEQKLKVETDLVQIKNLELWLHPIYMNLKVANSINNSPKITIQSKVNEIGNSKDGFTYYFLKPVR